MKKIYTIGLAIAAVAALASCAKENSVEKISNEQKITVQTNFEDINIPGSKVTINEDGTKFHLNWDGDETFIVYNSKNNKGGGSNVFSISSHSGANASFTGTPSDAGSGTANYIATFNYAQSVDNYVMADLPATQTYSADGAIANNCLLIARTDDVTASTLNTFDFKTMNAFMKFSLKKGSKAAGSSNDYTKMYVQSIKIETVADDEVIAGRFGFNKTGAWGTAYDKTVTGQEKSAVTLNCVTASLTNGVELDPSTAKDFYVAIAFGTYSKGLKVTVTVKNQDGDLGTYQRTISNNKSYSVARNKLIAMPTLTVNPDDAVVVTYTKVIGTVATGDYVIGYVSGGTVYALKNTTDESYIRFNEETVATNVVTNPDATSVWHYDSTTGYIQSVDNSNYIYFTGSSNKGFCGTTASAHTITEQSTSGNYYVAVGSRILRYTGASGYRYYTFGNANSELCFFKKD